MQQPIIILDGERLRHPNTGLFHFCWHLCRAIPQVLPEGYGLRLYLPRNAPALVANGQAAIRQHTWHRWLMQVPAKEASLWHCTNQGTSYFPAASRLKIVLTVHDLNFLYDDRKSQAKKNRYLAKLEAKLQRADAIVAISEYVRHDLLRHTKADGARISVIYNGSTIDGALKPEPPAQPPPVPFLFTIGTIVDKKNFHVLPGMLVDNDDTLVLAGIVQSESYKTRIMEEARRLGVEKRVLFTGAITEAQKYWYLQHCAAFVFPSLSEGFGLPVIEAMHFGKPVLLSRATSLPEVGGPHAYYFDSFEPQHMSRLAAHAILDVAANKKEPAIQAWAARFSWQKAAKAYCAIYEQLLS